MTNEEIKELLRIFNESGVGELELERAGERIRIRKAGEAASAPAPVAAAPMMVHEASAEAAPAASVPGAPPKSGEPTHADVKSPIVGTFYDAPSPGAAPFIKVGDNVEVGQVLCIIESMKLMNEIESEVAGMIAAKLVENGRPVEYGQVLFTIQPR